MSEMTVECAHAICNCEVTAPMTGEAYCSDYCQDAALTDDQDFCACGHPPCDEP
ncbi:MAG TPA: hypothetical protein VN905_06525 [Candidatus Binatia bacterium]|nr:hypothetical protein [Candidatus Binatia bacterium]